MKKLHFVLILLLCLVVTPVCFAAAKPFGGMSSSTTTFSGSFGSAGNIPLKSSDFEIPEGSLYAFGDMSNFGDRYDVKVLVSGMDPLHVMVPLSIPGFYPGVSPTDKAYRLLAATTLSAPNVIYAGEPGKDNTVKYVLTGWTGTGSIAKNGTATAGMITKVVTNLAVSSTITWNYKKMYRITVTTSGETRPLAVYDLKGATAANSPMVTNIVTSGTDSSGIFWELTKDMTVVGYGIPEGTTVSAVSSMDGTVTLSNPATQTYSADAGQRLTFAIVPATGSGTADPRECPTTDQASIVACVNGTGTALSGVHFYDTGAQISILAYNTFNEAGVLRTLTQVISSPGGQNAQQILGGRMVLTTANLSKHLEFAWRYDPTKVFTVGDPLNKPTVLLDGEVIDDTTRPSIKILTPDPTLPNDTPEAAFVWAWDNSDPNNRGMKYFPIHPVTSFTISWPLVGTTATHDQTGKTVWPALQKHIANAPANLQPPGAINTFNSISYTTNAADAALSVFTADRAGKSVLRFNTPAIANVNNNKPGAAFMVVESVVFDMGSLVGESCVIGSKIENDKIHKDPENKTGYLYNNGGVYDGVGPDKAYDRTTRSGVIIPVNESSAGDLNPLVVVWYETGNFGIGWPTTPKRYEAAWPSPNPVTITIGEGKVVSADYPKAMVYNQPDSNQPGFNPNEEHALLTGGSLYALRNDLNGINNYSKPYVLLKYFDRTAQEWKMVVYSVQRPVAFTYGCEVGAKIMQPLPGSFLVLAQSDIKKNPDNSEAGGEWHLRDHKGEHWAKAANWAKVYPAGWKPSDGEPPLPVVLTGESRLVMQWYYQLLPDFYWPAGAIGISPKKAGDVVPFLNNDAGKDATYKDTDSPIDVTYVTYWPQNSPVLKVGDTLTTAKDNLPALYNFKSAEVIFDENVYTGKGPLAKLYAPEIVLYADLAVLPAGIKTATGPDGVLTFPELPFALEARLFYDAVNQKLGFKGIWVSSEGAIVTTAPGATDWLLPNVMTAGEREVIKKTATFMNCSSAVNSLYKKSRNPNGVTYPASGAIINPFNKALSYILKTWQGLWGLDLGLQPQKDSAGKVVSPVAARFLNEKTALTAGMAQGEGYVVIAENNDAALSTAAVVLHVIKVAKSPVFQGVIKAIKSKNLFDETLTLHYTGDFGGEPERFTFDWYYQPVVDGRPDLPAPGAATGKWLKFTDPDAITSAGQTNITIKGASTLTMSDNWFAARYYYKDAWPKPISTDPIAGNTVINWSGWSGEAFDSPLLAMGWIKRVIDGLNPLEARVKDFRNSATNTTVSMLSQFGGRFDGAVALNSDPANLNSMGLISAYETVLNRGRLFSIDAVPFQDYGPTNDALLNISSRLATFYLALGNEAYADAADPTIGYSTKSAEYGNMAPSVFAFQNQADSLLEEELALMRGRDDSANSTRNAPYYNRLIWNFTQGEGEVAYQQNYGITDQNKIDGITAADAMIMYPQGHGDAWGHYLQAINYYYKLLNHPHFSWAPRVEFVQVGGNSIMVDYLDERKFAAIASSRAKVGAEILDLTYRKFYTDDAAGQWKGYKDTYTDRAWGVDEWARRAGQGAYFDWITANAILPDSSPTGIITRITYVPGPNGELVAKEIDLTTDLQKIDRAKTPELVSIAAQFQKMQAKMNEVDSGVNPLGLVKGVVPFDIDPVLVSSANGVSGKTHFEQIYDRAAKALESAIVVYDYANGFTQRLRQNQDTLAQFKNNLDDQERDYRNRLIEIFGYPYGDDIGSGKTYPTGYDGPDIFHFDYVNMTELTGEQTTSYKTYTNNFRVPGDWYASMGVLTQNNSPVVQKVEFKVDGDHHWLVKPAEWNSSRRAPGKIQQTLSDLIIAQAAYVKALGKFDGMNGAIKDASDNLQIRYNVLAKEISLRDTTNGSLSTLDTAIQGLHQTSSDLRWGATLAEDIADGISELFPSTVGLSFDAFSIIRGGIKIAGYGFKSSLNKAADITDNQEFSKERLMARTQAGMELKLAKYEANYEVYKLVQELQAMLADVDLQLLEIYSVKESLNQSVGAYLAARAEGDRLLSERTEKRAQSAANVQEYRYQDLGFRVFRNDAIQKYRAQFDLAAKYVYLAATAYDYETNLLGTASGSGRKFLSEIARQRSLGVVSNGVPLAGFPGLADVMGRLSQNFNVYKTQLGFNNPQTETTPFSLRTELFRIKTDATSDGDWRNVLKDHKVPDLWQIPEFKRYCRPFAPESAGPQPGIVIRFPTTITYGKNFFGWPLSGGDSAYSTSNFATKVRSVGLWFQNYNKDGLSLSSTPRVYLVPIGADVLRSPTGDGFALREWQVKDQKLPVPFPIGDTDLKNPSFIPVNDSLSEELSAIRRVSDFRAYPYSGAFNSTQAATDSRLIGRSVWNTQWMMIIPGSTLLSNKDDGLNTFINTVNDIEMFFQTYAYSGN